ncbi:MAG: hypothetical protein HXY34_06645 [Candidatus Thorarchaeota archaeon]|nr:hypothetical protein [Candidatus Thorarchaeota archaeon]
MQILWSYVLSVVAAFGLPYLFWGILVYLELKGMDLLAAQARGEIASPTGVGAWYARNISSTRKQMLYYLITRLQAPITFYLVASFCLPGNIPTILIYFLPTLLVFTVLEEALCGSSRMELQSQIRGWSEGPSWEEEQQYLQEQKAMRQLRKLGKDAEEECLQRGSQLASGEDSPSVPERQPEDM